MFIFVQRMKRTLVLAAMLAALVSPVFLPDTHDAVGASQGIEVACGIIDSGGHGGGC